MWRHKLNDWETINKDAYKFCFEQSEKRLKEILDDGEKITIRTYTLIGIIIPLLSVTLGVFFKSIGGRKEFSSIEIVCIASTLILGGCVFYLSKLIRARKIWYSGTQPMDIVQSQYLEKKDWTDEEGLKYLYLSEMEMIQDKITNNKNENEKRIDVFNTCLKVVIISAIGTLTSILILSVL
jgi:hypothetical protein